MVRFRYLPVASPLLPDEERRTIVRRYEAVLRRAGGTEFTPGSHGVEEPLPADTDADEPIVCFVVTGGTEATILDYARERSSGAQGASILLVAYPGGNSLPAALEALARLEQDGLRGRVIFLEGPDDRAGAGRLVAALAPGVTGTNGDISATYLRKPKGLPLAGMRIGLVGKPSDWLVASSPPLKIVTEVWGPEIVEIPMAELEGRIDSCRPDTAESFAEDFAARASRMAEPRQDDLVASGTIYAALRSLVDELGLDAVSVRCFDLVVERKATGCLALSRLADEGLVAGCEGDLPSAVAMLWVRERLGAKSWMANPARVDIESNTLRLAHCTVPCSMVDGFELRSHFESRLGAAVQGNMAPGPVTLLRIGGQALDRLWIAEGKIMGAGFDETMCRTQVDVLLRDSEESEASSSSIVAESLASVTDLLERPLGNHLVLTRGHVSQRLLDGSASRE